MSDRLYVATRKGFLTFVPEKGGWRLAGSAFLGDPVSAVLHDPRDGALYAALNLGHFGVKLHRSDDTGKSWTEIAAPAFAEEKDAPPPDPSKDWPPKKTGPSVELIWTLVPGGDDQPGQLWAGTLPGGLFLSTDRGESWSLIESLWNDPTRPEWFGGGYDSPGIHSICIDPRASACMVIGVSCAGVWRSEDSGANWRLHGKGLRNAYMPPDKAFDTLPQDPHRLAQCAAAPDTIWCQHHNGIFLSRDGGTTFTEIEADAPSHFGFAVAVHPADPDTAWFIPAVKDESRYPVDHRLVVMRTKDGGQSFETFSDGLPNGPSFDLIYRHGLDIDADGARLAMGSTTGNLWVGEKEGTSWALAAPHLPPIYQVAWSAQG
jgi:hypothetical protein